MHMLTIETACLLIRPFTMDDLTAIHHILDVELAGAEVGTEGTQTLDGRECWLHWTILGYEQYAALYQPPYGERAIVLRETGQVIGACGYVPCLDQFDRLPSLRATTGEDSAGLGSTEFGLYWAVSPRYQRQGYATEAAGALIDDAFTRLGLRQIIATTTYDNTSSIRVMEKVGMWIDKNPSDEPPWLQVVGVVYHPELRRGALGSLGSVHEGLG
jgi:ribosomal-protein-alanine N-acetyltransferase